MKVIVKYVNLSELTPYPSNPRKISEAAMADLCQSILEDPLYFETRPIICSNRTGRLVIIAGEKRFIAANRLGMKEAPVAVIPNLTESDEIRILFKDNGSFGEWDVVMLKELQENGWDLSGIDKWGVNISIDEYEKTIPEEFDDDVPGVSDSAITMSGDVWEINNHRLICGDSTKAETYQRLMGDKKASMIFTDPPYNLPADKIGNKGKKKHRDFITASGEMTIEEFTEFLRKVFINLVSISVNGSIHFICMDWRHVMEVLNASHDVYSQFKNLIVWNKNIAGMGSFYNNKHELIFAFKNGEEKHIKNFGFGERSNVWDYPSANSLVRKDSDDKGMLKNHPTPKPVQLVSDAIVDCSTIKDIIVDGFLGSGTTLISSEKTDRICYGVEMDPLYCDLIIRRYFMYAKKKGFGVVLKRNGQSVDFDSLFKPLVIV